jgi:hypothetical protein
MQHDQGSAKLRAEASQLLGSQPAACHDLNQALLLIYFVAVAQVIDQLL